MSTHRFARRDRRDHLDNPPVNGLGHDFLIEPRRRRRRAGRCAVKAIVITGAGNAFSGGADIRGFTTPSPADPPVPP